MKLTEPMKVALRKLNAGSMRPGDFRTMEALRKRGLADRHTTMAIRAEYVTKDDNTVQYRATARKPRLIHEWYRTSAGLQAEQKSA
jgi:hypothetical protein